ncbi:MAG: methyltransferase domain-containing protein [Candidatus Methanoperedens sp.]|nr:methyltransferase domain-containing protein [Candidatus Methanoperedens sp.]MCZ7370890.1 methyltransferase domain-containing protein [Candidatus Methanoperedens sp.]
MLFPSGTPTQPEVIAVALSKLCLEPTDIFADIGCGSGSVSMSASRRVKHVYAIDNRDEAIRASVENIKECGATNITFLNGEASFLLSGLDIDCAFLGGSKNIEHVLEVLMKRVPRFVVSAARIETAALALGILKDNNKFRELLQLQISRGSELAGGTMLRTENPVFLIVGCGSC